MKAFLWAGLLLATAGAATAALHLRRSADGAVAHAENTFSFTVSHPLAEVAPLFGAWAERAWAGADWDPRFLHPRPAADREGAVFTVSHGRQRSVWINTALDLERGFVQYAYVLPGVQAVRITIRLREEGRTTCAVVQYQRTALDPAHNALVLELGRRDAGQGPEWAAAIERCLRDPAGTAADGTAQRGVSGFGFGSASQATTTLTK